LRLLDALPLLASLTEVEKQVLAETMTRKTYRKGEVLVEEGGKLSSLVIIRTGVVVVACHREEGELELRRLAPGDYFGESGLVPSAGETATFRALTFTVVYEVGHAALAKLMQDRPSIADEISQTLSRRAKEGISLAADDDRAAAAAPAVSVLASRIRRLFQMPRGSAGWTRRSVLLRKPPPAASGRQDVPRNIGWKPGAASDISARARGYRAHSPRSATPVRTSASWARPPRVKPNKACSSTPAFGPIPNIGHVEQFVRELTQSRHRRAWQAVTLAAGASRPIKIG
jgi:CRP-like cAMP-binding protein